MAELISREKELVKINNKLDRLTNDAFDKQITIEYPIINGGSSLTKITNFLPNESTYKTYTKRKGATTLLKKLGAGDGAPDHKERSDRTFTRNNTNNYKGTLTKTTPVGPKNSPQTKTNVSSSGSTATYVKYRNLNFRESNSLDQLIENEKNDSEESTTMVPKTSVTSVINGSVKKLNMDNYVKYLKTQIVMYQADNERMKVEMSKQRETLERTLECNKHMELQRDQAVCLNHQISDKLCNVEHQFDELTRSSKEQQREQNNKQREFEAMKRDLRVLKQTNTNLENRLMRAQEEFEAARNNIGNMKAAERDLKEATRLEIESKDKQIKNLKRQRADLLKAYKKQLFMIDNLKRQNACMEHTAMLGFGEKEFSKVLEWNLSN